jgi:hypothetical protein
MERGYVMEDRKSISEIMKEKALRKKEKEESPNVNKLIIERDPAGLYYCRYSLSGRVPDALMGKFTRINAILEVARAKQIPLDA